MTNGREAAWPRAGKAGYRLSAAIAVSSFIRHSGFAIRHSAYYPW